jgi:hypothetical protein
VEWGGGDGNELLKEKKLAKNGFFKIELLNLIFLKRENELKNKKNELKNKKNELNGNKT